MVYRFCKRSRRFSTGPLVATAIASVLLLTGCGGEFVPTTGVVNVDGERCDGHLSPRLGIGASFPRSI